MNKYVLCKDLNRYRYFLSVKRDNRRDISSYKYVTNSDYLRGLSIVHEQIVRLGSFNERSDKDEILEVLATKGVDLRRPHNRFGDPTGGTITIADPGRYEVSSNITWSDGTSSALDTSSTITIPNNATMTPGEIFMSPRHYEELFRLGGYSSRGMIDAHPAIERIERDPMRDMYNLRLRNGIQVFVDRNSSKGDIRNAVERALHEDRRQRQVFPQEISGRWTENEICHECGGAGFTVPLYTNGHTEVKCEECNGEGVIENEDV